MIYEGACVRRLSLTTAWWFSGLLGLAFSVHPCVGQITVDQRPVLTIPGTRANGTPVFGRLAGATRLRNGQVVIGDGSGNVLRVFDAQGRQTATVGRPGQGPGEFALLRWVQQCTADSVFAYDMMRKRVSVFTAAGAFVRQFQVPGMPSCSPYGSLAFFASQGETPPPAAATVWRASAPLQLGDAHGSIVREIGSIPAFEIAAEGRGWLPRPGGAITSVAVGREVLAVCPTAAGALGVYRLAGNRVTSVPLDAPRRQPSRQNLERSVDAQIAFIPAGSMRDTMRQRLLRLPAPEFLPPCSQVLLDPSGAIWVRVSFPGDGATRFRIIGPSLTPLAEVTIAEELDVFEVGGDYLLAGGENPDGDTWVRLYRVRRAGR